MCPISSESCLGAGCLEQNKGVDVPGPSRALGILGKTFLGFLAIWQMPSAPLGGTFLSNLVASLKNSRKQPRNV